MSSVTAASSVSLDTVDAASGDFSGHAQFGMSVPPRQLGPGWIAHAGLGRHRPGGTPTAITIEAAIRLGVDRIELDVLATLDGQLVLRHDTRLAGGARIADLTASDVERLTPETLRLDEGVDHVDRRTPLLLDIKSEEAVVPLARWLSGRRDRAELAVCSESVEALLCVGAWAPEVARWPSLPDLGIDPTWRRWVLAAAREHRTPWHAGQFALELVRGLQELPDHRDHALARLGGVPWRRRLPGELAALVERTGAAAVCVHHCLVTPELIDAAHRCGVAAVAWTVNDGDAVRRVAEFGADLITTDDVAGMRRAAAGSNRLSSFP